MVATTLSQSILQGMDPSTYRNIQDIQNGEDYLKVGQDASPTTKWGAVGRLANALAGSYIQNSATSDLAKTIAGGKKSAQDQLMAALESQQKPSVPSAPPAVSPGIPPSAPTPGLQPNVPQAQAPITPDPGSPNAQVANRFPAEMSPGTAASPLPNSAPSPLDTAQYPAGPVGGPSEVAATNPVAGINAAIQPRGIRNNNALNIEDGGFAKSQPGYAGSDGRFAKFQTPEHGVAAANALLDTYGQKHGLNTVAGIVGRWAPQGDGNNVSAYASDVAGKLGIDPNAPVPPAMRPQLIAAMAQHENGVAAPGTSGAPQSAGAPVQLASAAPQTANDADPEQAAPKGQQVAQNGTPDFHKLMAVLQNPYADETTKALAQKLLLKQFEPDDNGSWGIVGKDKYGQPVYGYPPTREQAAAQPKTVEKADPLEGLQGPQRLDALKQSDPARASQAQAVLEGRTPYPTGSRLNPQQQQLKEDVTQIDPNFSAGTWTARNNFSKSMGGTAPNTYGGQLFSAGTVAKHLGDAHDYLPIIEKGALGASDTLPSLNGVKGFIRNQAGDKEYQDATGHFETVRKGLSDEAEKLLAGSPGAEGSKLYWMDRLDLSKHSPTEVRGSLDEFRSLMNGRISNIAQEKDRVFGNESGHTDPLNLFGPKEQEIMKKVQKDTYSGRNSDATPSTATASAPAGPDRAALEAEMRRRGLLQ